MEKKIPDGCIEIPLEEVDYIYQPPQSHTPVIVMKQKLPPMQSRVLECMKCGSKKNLNTNKDKSFVECDDCMWGIEKDGTRLADEFYSLAPRYRTKVKLQEMIDKWLDKAREEGYKAMFEGLDNIARDSSGGFYKGVAIIKLRNEIARLYKLKDNK